MQILFVLVLLLGRILFVLMRFDAQEFILQDKGMINIGENQVWTIARRLNRDMTHIKETSNHVWYLHTDIANIFVFGLQTRLKEEAKTPLDLNNTAVGQNKDI